jgi:hypothetical protein
MTNEDPIMDDEQAGEAVAKYLEYNPELLQGIVPSHDLWPAIESRIAARVVPMQSDSARAARKGAAWRTWGWVPMLAAASTIAVASAGITYVFARRGAMRGDASTFVASATTRTGPVGVRPATAAPGVDGEAAGQVAIAGGQSDTHRNDGSPRVVPPTTQSTTNTTRGAAVRARLASHSDGGDAIRTTYDNEIMRLHAVLESRRGQLNPSTVAIIEQNLRVIDDAITQSRAALARDPNSRLLNDQLDHTLAKKTDLLRAAALLPSA